MTKEQLETHETLWGELYDCIAVKVNDNLCFPAEFDDEGNQIHIELEDETVILIDRNDPIPCKNIGSGIFKIDYEGKNYEIMPLFNKED